MQDDARAEIVALCARYHDALHRSDAELLGSLFHDKALYATTTDGDIRFWSMDRYLPVVARRPSPSARKITTRLSSRRAIRPQSRQPRRSAMR